MERLSGNEKLDPLLACLSYPLCNQKIARTVVGVANAAQFFQILKVANECEKEIEKTFRGKRRTQFNRAIKLG